MPSKSTPREPYCENARRLVTSIDVGTTFTAASFCILQPDVVPVFVEILRWPKQAVPDAKVPSVLYYDKDNTACAFGAETDDEDTIVKAEELDWRKIEWWKLHLRPSYLPIIKDLKLPSLPANVTVDDIFADHLGYVNRQIKAYITSTYAEGDRIWTTLSPTMHVILTTPNGWEGSQQNRMRQAAIKAGLVDNMGGGRVQFVTEAEAAVLYAADMGSVNDWLVQDGHLIICDCGGGTIDISSYKITNTKPLQLEEDAASRCYLAGAIFVTEAAKTYLKERLKGTEWDTDDAIGTAVANFERSAKRKFEGPETTSWIKLDGYKSLPRLNIVRGKMKIPWEDMASLYKGSLECIKEGLEIAFEGSRRADKVILVGGLASSFYVHAELVKWGREHGISVSRPDGPMTKAVANGALAWHVDSTVASRFSKNYYGVEIRVPFDSAEPDHAGRKTHTDAAGAVKVTNAWDSIVEKNKKIEAGIEFISHYSICVTADQTTLLKDMEIMAYRRATKPPTFTSLPGQEGSYQPGFEVICTVQFDLTQCLIETPVKMSPTGAHTRTLEFQICLSLGGTEIAARTRWTENGEHKYSPASIAYE